MVPKLTKGKKTRDSILNEAREIFNEEGVFLTLRELSKIIGMTIGGITNHFPTKDHLFVALAEAYEMELGFLTSQQDYGQDFEKIATFFGKVMDIQYKYRSVILFFSATHQSQKELLNQIGNTWNKRLQRLEKMVEAFVEYGLITPKILEKKEFEVFKFQYVNLFTTWLVSFSLYDTSKTFNEIKPIYLEGILRLFDRYLTEKGEKQIRELKFSVF